MCRKLKNSESYFHHPLFDLRGTRKVETRHTNFHFSGLENYHGISVYQHRTRKVEV